MKILLVEDDRKIALFIKNGLAEQSYAVDIAEIGDSTCPTLFVLPIIFNIVYRRIGKVKFRVQ